MSGRDRRALLLGSLLLIPGFFWILIARPYMRALDNVSVRLAAEQDLLARERSVLAAADRYPTEIERGAERLLEAASRLFGGASSGVASAHLARYLQELAQGGPALLTRLEPVAEEPAGTGLLALPLHVLGESDLEGLLTLLHSLESGPKLVRVDDLKIRGVRNATRTGAEEAEVLSFEFKATGFMLTEPEEKRPGAQAVVEVADGEL